MLKTNEITFDAVNDTTSDSFLPKSSFVLQAVGTIDSNVEFIVQQIPYQLDDTSTAWAAAPMTPTAIESDTPVATINFAYGYKYRIMKSGSGTQSTTGLTFHFGNGTFLSYALAS